MTAVTCGYRVIIRALAWGTGGLLVAVTLLVLFAAGIRYLGIWPGYLHWVSELTRFAIIWLVMLGSAVAHDQGAHVAIEMPTTFPPKLRRFMGIAGALVSIAFLVVLFVYGLELSLRTMRQLTPALKMPTGFAYLALPVGASLMLLQTFLFVMVPGLSERRDEVSRAALGSEP